MKTDKNIGNNKKLIKKVNKNIEEKAHVSYVGSDPTRLKMLLILEKNEKMCTSELAEILGISVSAVSHQKTILERYGLISSQRDGKKICCLIKNRKLSNEILNGIK